MPQRLTLNDFNKLCILLDFTKEQAITLVDNITYPEWPINNTYNALHILHQYKITERLTPDISSACLDSVISEDAHPEDSALIICEFATAGVLSTIEKTHARLTAIEHYPNKKELHVALTWLNSLGLPNELIQYYFLSETTLLPKYGPVVFEQISACLKRIITTKNSTLLDTVSSLTKLLKHAYVLPYDQHVKLIHMVCSHPDISTLDTTLASLDSSVLFKPFTTSSLVYLNTILQDQNTPDATASILKLIISDDIFASEKPTQNYCNKVACYPDKACLNAVAFELNEELAWPPERIKACALEILNIQKAPPQIDVYVRQFLHAITQYTRVVSEDCHQHVMPFTNPNTLAGFLSITSLLQGADQRFEDYIDNVTFASQAIKARLGACVLTNRNSIYSIHLETLQAFIHALGNNIERHLPHKPSLKKHVFESNGHALYCGRVMRTSSLFFSRLENTSHAMSDDDAEAKADAINEIGYL